MNDLIVFTKGEWKIRSISKDGEPLFVAADVCAALELGDTSKAAERLDADEKDTNSIPTPGGDQQMTVVTESGLYSLVLGSRKPVAKTFKRWITHEVLPTIRKTGSYALSGNETEARLTRANAMLLNAKNRALKTIMQTVGDKNLSPLAMQLFGLTAIEQITGQHIDYRPEVEKTYTATEIAAELHMPAQTVGKMAVSHNLKTPENGIWALDKSPYSAKQVQSFRYNEKGRAALIGMFGDRAEQYKRGAGL